VVANSALKVLSLVVGLHAVHHFERVWQISPVWSSIPRFCTFADKR
jgi:hypothetical protein